MEFLLFMSIPAAVTVPWIWGSYFGEVTGDHRNGVPVDVHVLDYETWKADEKKKRNEAIRLALAAT